MNKIWYIYVGGHLGPFNAEEIFRLYYQHQISEKTFLWRRGEKDWRKLEDYPEIYDKYKKVGNPIRVFKA